MNLVMTRNEFTARISAVAGRCDLCGVKAEPCFVHGTLRVCHKCHGIVLGK